ncbi:MAG TPA: hypothetical protein VIM57_01285 [Luteolibacter sp.]
MNRNTLLALAAITVVAGGSFLAGRLSVSGDSPQNARESEGRAVSSRSMEGSVPPGGESLGKGRADDAKSLSIRSAGKDAKLAKLEEIVRKNDPVERNRALLAFLDQLGPGDMREAVDRFKALDLGESRNGEYAMLLAAWAKADPVAALTHVKEDDDDGFALKTILATWAGNDPDAALRWADSNFQGDGANPYLIGIVQGIAATDLNRATQLLTSMPYSNERGEALAALLPYVLTKGGEAAREWVFSIQDEQLREGVLNRVVEQLASKEPKETADWLLANPSQATIRQLDDALAAWTEKDQKGAIAYYDALPAGEARTNALRGIVNTMAGENPREAARFMDSHPADTNDQVVQQFVWHSSQGDPALAASYIAKISNEREQINLYNRMLNGWMRRDPAAASAWIRSNPLPQAVQIRLPRGNAQ